MKHSMKISFYTALILGAAALISLPLALIRVNSGKENIIITEETLYGDPKAAEKITLQLPVHWNGQLFWETEYIVGSGRADSRFSYSSRPVSRGWTAEESSASAKLESSVTYTVLSSETGLEADDQALGEIVRKVAEKTGAGDSKSEVVKIGDYYEYYSLNFEIQGDFSLWYEGDYNEASAYLAEFFHISTAEDRMEVTVEKSREDLVVLVNARVIPGDGELNIFDASAFGDKGFFYAWGLEEENTGGAADRGQNQGIFYFPWEKDEKGFFCLDLTRVQKVCELPQGAFPRQMLLDQDRGLLYLAVEREEEYELYLYNFQGEIPVPAQQIPISRYDIIPDGDGFESDSYGWPEEGGFFEGSFYGDSSYDRSSCEGGSYEEDQEDAAPAVYFSGMSLEEGGVLMTWSDNSFAFVAEEGGTYEQWCSGVFPGHLGEMKYAASPFPERNECAFDGVRLILGAYENRYGLNVILAVYDEREMLYAGLYRHSEENDVDEGYNLRSVQPQGARRRLSMEIQGNLAIFQTK